MGLKADVLICGAGIAGISAAYHLAAKQGIQNVILVDENAPLSLTSDHSTECYRNWWPGPGDAMVALMNRSVDILEELATKSGNVFHLNRRGYLYLTDDQTKIPDIKRIALEISELGAGPLRIHTGQPGDPEYIPAPSQDFTGQPTGADLILDTVLIRRHFPYLSECIVAALHARRAGWFSAQQLGMYLLEQARDHRVKLLRGRVNRIELENGRVVGVRVDDGTYVETPNVVNAAGPFLKDVGRMVGVELPVYNELHLKVAMKDPLNVLDRSAPLLIWMDAQTLDWAQEERDILAGDAELRWLLNALPSGAHTRPEGGPDSQIILLLWDYPTKTVDPVWPLPIDPQYPEITLRGLVKMIPGMGAYIGKAPRPRVDGGYYTRTRENRPLIGKMPVPGAYIIGALSGYGMMASCAAGELLAAHVTGDTLPTYAPAFALERYKDPAYQSLLENWVESGQL